jgi:hypothetical protein
VTLSQAKALVSCAAHEQSFLILSPPGVGKSDAVAQAAEAAGLPCRSLLGTQLAPEDVSGVPFIVGERSVFCPPRVLLPESPEPFCLFLDELPACTPDIQKAFYSLLLERRLGEHALPAGTWVVAAGNRTEDRALVRTISSALVNRVVLLQVRVDLEEWLAWAASAGVRKEITSYIEDVPHALLRPVPDFPHFPRPGPGPLSRAIDSAQRVGILDEEVLAALTAGRVSAEDVQPLCTWLGIVRRAGERGLAIGRTRLLNMSIEDLALPARVVQELMQIGICTIRELVIQTPADLRKAFDMDQSRVREVEEALAEYGLVLGMTL